MRHVIVGLCFTGGLLTTGCSSMPWARSRAGQPGLRVASTAPEQLVAALNQNAGLIQSLECSQVDLDCTQNHQQVGLQGRLVCQKPRNFRMVAKLAGNTIVDMGSNDQEFWYWISKAEPPYLFHCSYQDFASGQVRMPFPFQPEWVMEALGLAEYDPAKHYDVAARGQMLELVQQATAPDGRSVRKVTVLKASQNQVQVVGHVLREATGQDICAAYVRELQQDRATAAVLPHIVQLVWPAQQISMKFKLDGAVVNGHVTPERKVALFTRPNLQGVEGYDLLRGPDNAGGPVRPAGTYR